MTTKESTLREIAHKLIQSRFPDPVMVAEIYAAVEEQVHFDAEDLTPPTKNGKPVSEPSWKRNVRNALQADKAALRLVNCAVGQWRLPSPLTVEQALSPDASWQDVTEEAKIYLKDERTIVVGVDGSRVAFRVLEVSDDEVVFSRVEEKKMHAKKALTKPEVFGAISRLNVAGGRTGVGTLFKPRDLEWVLVSLHPDLSLSEDETQIVVRDTKNPPSVAAGPPEDELNAAMRVIGREGRKKISLHYVRERDPAAIRKYKEQYQRENKDLPCQVCGFSFGSRYSCGAGYIEAHHRVPLSEVDEHEGTATTYEDIVFVCANCHKMLHRPFDGRYLSVEALINLLLTPR